MNRLGIKYQILLITFIPAFLIDAFFTYSHITSSIQQAQEILQDKGKIISRQISGASEFYLFSGINEQIEYILNQTVGTDDIVLAAVYNSQGELVAEARTQSYQTEKTAEYFYHHQPIMSQSFEVSDVFTPDLTEESQTSIIGWVHIYFSKDQLIANESRIIRNAVVFFVFVLIMTLILTIIISRGITNPIYKLIEHLRRVETGHLGELIDPVEFNEIGAVQRGFNRMTQALVTNRQHLNDRIEQATQQLSEAITNLESKNRELGFARDEALHANKVKSQFLANMSHEIRTPINGIKGFINLMTQSELSTDQRRYAEIILKSTNDLTAIIEEILDFSKLESGKLQIIETNFDLYEVIEQTRDILYINVINKQIDLNLIIYSDTPRIVTGDRLRLRQVLLNLIGNAVKFTDEGSVTVRVQLEQESDDQVELLITVEDTGIGITEENQQALFKAFSQVESESNRRYSGTGLGLVISKNLVNLMGGDISLSSEFGHGTRFTIRIPFSLPAKHDLSTAEQQESKNAFLFACNPTCLQEIQSLYERIGVVTEANLLDADDKIDLIRQTVAQNIRFIDFVVIDLRHCEFTFNQFSELDTLSELPVLVMHYDQTLVPDLTSFKFLKFVSVITTSSQLQQLIYHPEAVLPEAEAEHPVQADQAKRVLLVDDNSVNLTLGCELIRLWGHEATAASDAEAAMQYYRSSVFDLIFLDIRMPEVDGRDLLVMMREEKPEDTTPIVALTAHIMRDEAKHLIEHGFSYYLSKPINEQKLKAILDGKSLDFVDKLTAGQQENNEQQAVGVDIEKTLALCAGNESLLYQIFEILLREIPDYRKQLEEALSLPDRAKVSMTIHKIHGVTCYASLPTVRRLVMDIQSAIDSNPDKDLSPLLTEIIEALNAVESTVLSFLETATSHSGVSPDL